MLWWWRGGHAGDKEWREAREGVERTGSELYGEHHGRILGGKPQRKGRQMSAIYTTMIISRRTKRGTGKGA